MTLNVTNNEIQIKNALGAIKFTSADKLVFLRAYQTGAITVSNQKVVTTFSRLKANEFLHLTVTFLSCNGSVGSLLVGYIIPANGSINLDLYGRAVSNEPSVDCEWLAMGLAGSQLVFQPIRISYDSTWVTPTTTTWLVYEARIYAYS